MKPFQSDHSQLLINTSWGVDRASVHHSAAAEQGLVDWKGRWVRAEERRRLQTEFNAYYHIRSIGQLAILGGLISLPQLGARWFGEILPGFRLRAPDHPIYVLLFSAVMIVSGVNLLRYRGWSRATLLGMLAVNTALMSRSSMLGTSSARMTVVGVVVLLLFAAALFSRTARVIFGPPSTNGP